VDEEEPHHGHLVIRFIADVRQDEDAVFTGLCITLTTMDRVALKGEEELEASEEEMAYERRGDKLVGIPKLRTCAGLSCSSII
jgi:hypothetical protein